MRLVAVNAFAAAVVDVVEVLDAVGVADGVGIVVGEEVGWMSSVKSQIVVQRSPFVGTVGWVTQLVKEPPGLMILGREQSGLL